MTEKSIFFVAVVVFNTLPIFLNSKAFNGYFEYKCKKDITDTQKKDNLKT